MSSIVPTLLVPKRQPVGSIDATQQASSLTRSRSSSGGGGNENMKVRAKCEGPLLASDEKISMDQLVTKLHECFSEDQVDVDELKALMASVDISRANWKRYEFYDQYRYTRNLVDEGNGKFNLIVLCWGMRHGSGIHDHMGAHCIVNVLQGSMKEEQFEWPEAKKDDNGRPHEMVLRETNVYKAGQVAYIHDKIGLHRVENPSHSEPLVTLHLYSPPYQKCHNFNQNTSEMYTCQISFMTRKGQRPDEATLDAAQRQVFDESH